MMPSRKYVIRLALITALILSIPLVGMRFSDGVHWSLFDFLFAGVLIFGTGMSFGMIALRANHPYRVATGLGLAAVLLLIWINGAVGIIGSEDNPANGLYVGVLLVVTAGAAIARFRPKGMSRALYATAFTQALVPLIALMIWKPALDDAEAVVDLIRELFLNAVFVLMFVGSAVMFRQASTDEPSASRVEGPA